MYTLHEPTRSRRGSSPADFALTSVCLEAERRTGRLLAEAEARRTAGPGPATMRGWLGRRLVRLGVALGGRELHPQPTGQHAC